jgi:hypothetical protein
MTFDLPSLPVLDRADNPYMPRHLQQVPLNLDPGDFALLQTLPVLPLSNIGLIDGTHGPIITTTGPVHNGADDSELDDIDDNSSDSLDSIEDHEFPSFFSQRSSPPRLFHSHGTYSLPVDGDEMKVCTSSFGASWLCRHSTSLKKMLPLPVSRGRKLNTSCFA